MFERKTRRMIQLEQLRTKEDFQAMLRREFDKRKGVPLCFDLHTTNVEVAMAYEKMITNVNQEPIPL